MSVDMNIEKYIDTGQYKNYPLIKSITVQRNMSSISSCEVEVILSSMNGNELVLLFQEVFNIKIYSIAENSNSFIDIMNISEAQITNATYFISANEDETFSFYCKSFVFYENSNIRV